MKTMDIETIVGHVRGFWIVISIYRYTAFLVLICGWRVESWVEKFTKCVLWFNGSWYSGNYVAGLGKTTTQITIVFNMWYIRTKLFRHNSEALTLEFIYLTTGFSGKLSLGHGLKYSPRFHWVIMNKTLLHTNLLQNIFKPPTLFRCSWEFELGVHLSFKAWQLRNTRFKHQFYILPTKCIWLCCMDLRRNWYYFALQH